MLQTRYFLKPLEEAVAHKTMTQALVGLAVEAEERVVQAQPPLVALLVTVAHPMAQATQANP